MQGVDDETFVGRIHRQTLEDFLVVDELRAGTRDALDDEIELVGRTLHAVVVDRDAQVLAAAGLARLQAQHLTARRNLERCARGAIRDAHDDGDFAAVPKEMLHGQRHEAEGRMAAEDATEFVVSLDGDRLVQRPALGAPDERYDGGRDYRNDFSAVLVGRAGAEVDRFGRHSAALRKNA